MKKIGIIGQGFVGTAVREGMKNHYEVLCYDKDGSKYSNSSLEEIANSTEVSFMCLPTPMRKDGSCDIRIIESALQDLESKLNKNFTVILKSTVTPGTTDRLNKLFNKIKIVFNPEFLTEAASIEDYKNQTRIIIGGDRPESTKIKQIFEKAFPTIPIIKTSPLIAETIKYVTNCFLATKISFANEIYQLCKALNIDYDKVIEYSKYDTRLGNSHWSVPGPDGDFGFGGHCFPKDIEALRFLAKELSVDSTVLDAVIAKNLMVRTDKDWEKQIGRAVSE
jgi:UDPglucose 6-dehydrogenase